MSFSRHTTATTKFPAPQPLLMSGKIKVVQVTQTHFVDEDADPVLQCEFTPLPFEKFEDLKEISTRIVGDTLLATLLHNVNKIEVLYPEMESQRNDLVYLCTGCPRKTSYLMRLTGPPLPGTNPEENRRVEFLLCVIFTMDEEMIEFNARCWFDGEPLNKPMTNREKLLLLYLAFNLDRKFFNKWTKYFPTNVLHECTPDKDPGRSLEEEMYNFCTLTDFE
jgi:hypothetical protein